MRILSCKNGKKWKKMEKNGKKWKKLEKLNLEKGIKITCNQRVYQNIKYFSKF